MLLLILVVKRIILLEHYQLSIHVGKNTIHPGDKQTITLKVTDANTSNAIVGAKITRKNNGCIWIIQEEFGWSYGY